MPRPKKQPSSWSYLTLETWCSELANRRFGIKLAGDSRFQQMLSVLENERPKAYPARDTKLNEMETATELGRRIGYDACMGVLLIMLSGLDTREKTPPPELPEYQDGTSEE